MLKEEMSVIIRKAESKDTIDRLVLDYFLKHLGENIYEKHNQEADKSEREEDQE